MFGDPAVGAEKTCWVDSQTTVIESPSTTTAPSTGTGSTGGATTPNDPSPPSAGDGGGATTPVPPTDGGSTAGPSSDAVTASFSPDNSTDFPNPERGWYIYAAYNGGLLASPSTWQSEVGAVKNNSYGAPLTLVFGYTSLANYAGSDITSSALSNLDTNLAYMRTAGTKAIIRFHYGSSMSTPAASPSLARMQAHMEQIKPILAKYRDVIYLVQTGFIGNYGEWWFTNNGTSSTDADSKSSKRTVQNAVLSMVPSEIPVATTCLYCTQEDWFPTVLSSAAAFNGSNLARTAFHNDCFMASANDQYQFPGTGTVNDFTFNKGALSQRTYIAAQSEFVPYGGETCAGSAQRLASSGGSDNAGLSGGILNEGPRYHLAYLNRAYYTGFMNQWSSEGTLSRVSRSIGYRFQFDSISHTDSVARGSAITVNVNMRNVGWARIYSARPLRVVLTNGSQTITGTSTTLLRQLPSQASSSTTVAVPISIPASATAGRWAVSLEMPDIYSTTQSNAFKIRPANANNGSQSWDPSSYRFITGTSINIQ